MFDTKKSGAQAHFFIWKHFVGPSKLYVMSYVKIGRDKLKIKECKKGRVKYHKKCLYCGVKFISNRETAIYCSDKCKMAYHRKFKEALDNQHPNF